MPIPKVIYFCNKTLAGMAEAAAPWATLNPDYELRFYDDAMCETFLETEFGPGHRDLFRWIKDGPIKADFWRICMLFKWGGVYSDVDNRPLVSIASFLEPTANFVTCSSRGWMNFVFNPNFIACEPGNPILGRCINWYMSRSRSGYTYWGWSIMRAFTETLMMEGYTNTEGIYRAYGQTIQIIQECKGQTYYDDHNVYRGVRIFNNRSPAWDAATHSFASAKPKPQAILPLNLMRRR
jgi:mannosyltransferase OCH1-like enzyme